MSRNTNTLRALNRSELQAPAGHGDILVAPNVAGWHQLLRDNHCSLAAGRVLVGDDTLARWRQRIRKLLVGDAEVPVVALGHQPEFIHPGVWAKHALASRFAQAVGGVAVNLVVDSDAVKQTSLIFPSDSRRGADSERIRFAKVTSGASYEHLPALDRNEVCRISRECRAVLRDRFGESMLPPFFDALESGSDARDWVEQMVAARRGVEKEWGVEMREHRVSGIQFTPLLLESMCEPRRFAGAYNDALRRYRDAHGVRDVHRPMPDLERLGERIELPWWLTRHGEARQRVFVIPQLNGLAIQAGAVTVAQLTTSDLESCEALESALRRATGWSIRPRAITLTLWARLLLADFFVHGIGGVKYDEICDGVMERYFGIRPPPMGCVSATLRWDPAVSADASPRAAEIRGRLRDFRFNPQRYIRADARDQGWLTQREKAITQAVASAQKMPHDRAARREAFQLIHEANDRLADLHAGDLRSLEVQLHSAVLQAAHQAVTQGREYFFAAYPRGELDRLAKSLPAVSAFGV